MINFTFGASKIMIDNQLSVFLRSFIQNELNNMYNNIDTRIKKLGIRQHRLENPVYPNIKFFSYLLDKEFTDEQKKMVY